MRSALLSAMVIASSAAVSQATVFQSWNLVVTGNLQNNSQDIEGRTFVGGNLVSSGTPTAAKNLDAGAFAGITTLAVAGNSSVANLNLQAGNFRYGGSSIGNINYNGGGNGAVDATLGAQAATLAVELASTSNFLRNLPATSMAQIPSGQPGAVRYVVAPGITTAVFNVAGSQVFNNNLIQQIELDAANAASIVINVSGTTINYNNGNMVGAWNTAFARANVIWNFYEATTINIDRTINGAVLAPSAHLTNFAAIDGSVFVASMNQSGEVHLPLYTGIIPAPSAAALLGLGALAAVRRRR